MRTTASFLRSWRWLCPSNRDLSERPRWRNQHGRRAQAGRWTLGQLGPRRPYCRSHCLGLSQSSFAGMTVLHRVEGVKRKAHSDRWGRTRGLSSNVCYNLGPPPLHFHRSAATGERPLSRVGGKPTPLCIRAALIRLCELKITKATKIKKEDMMLCDILIVFCQNLLGVRGRN